MISQIQIYEIFLYLIMLWHVQFCIYFLASLWLKNHHENKTIGMFCVILVILFFPINIAININIVFLVFCFKFLYLFENFVLWQNETCFLNLNLTLSCIILENDQTYFKNIVVFTTQVFLSMFGHFSILYMKGLKLYRLLLTVFQM